MAREGRWLLVEDTQDLSRAATSFLREQGFSVSDDPIESMHGRKKLVDGAFPEGVDFVWWDLYLDGDDELDPRAVNDPSAGLRHLQESPMFRDLEALAREHPQVRFVCVSSYTGPGWEGVEHRIKLACHGFGLGNIYGPVPKLDRDGAPVDVERVADVHGLVERVLESALGPRWVVLGARLQDAERLVPCGSVLVAHDDVAMTWAELVAEDAVEWVEDGATHVVVTDGSRLPHALCRRLPELEFIRVGKAVGVAEPSNLHTLRELGPESLKRVEVLARAIRTASRAGAVVAHPDGDVGVVLRAEESGSVRLVESTRTLVLGSASLDLNLREYTFLHAIAGAHECVRRYRDLADEMVSVLEADSFEPTDRTTLVNVINHKIWKALRSEHDRAVVEAIVLGAKQRASKVFDEAGNETKKRPTLPFVVAKRGYDKLYLAVPCEVVRALTQ